MDSLNVHKEYASLGHSRAPRMRTYLTVRRFRDERFARTRILIAVLLLVAGCAPQNVQRVRKPVGGVHHVVRAGDNLFRIGRAYGISHDELARINGINDPAQIRPGQRIWIPGAAHQVAVAPVTQDEPVSTGGKLPEQPPSGSEGFVWPVNGIINSTFGRRGLSFHDGIDIAAPEGTPIRAIAAGEVIYSDILRGYGNTVIVRHEEAIVSIYAHNEANLVREGQTVSRGEVIGRVGSTGRVTGPHLHFEIRKNNAAQDPLNYLPQLCCVAASDIP